MNELEAIIAEMDGHPTMMPSPSKVREWRDRLDAYRATQVGEVEWFRQNVDEPRVTAEDVDAMEAAYDQVVMAPRDMKLRRLEAAAFALRDRWVNRLSIAPARSLAGNDRPLSASDLRDM